MISFRQCLQDRETADLRHAVIVVRLPSTAVIFRQASIRRNSICPLARG
jgi:hypothetical protein